MARYVVLSFDDNSDADSFIEFVNAKYSKAIVRGLYAKPTVFCDCGADPTNLTKTASGAFRRGAKFGWWVHHGCGKVTKQWAQGDFWHATLGRNLLPVSEDAPEYRGDGVYGMKWDTTTRAWVTAE